MNYDQELQTQLTSALSQMKAQGRSQDEMQRAADEIIKHYQSSNSNNNQPLNPANPGVFQSIIQGVSSLPLRVGANAAVIGEGGAVLGSSAVEHVAKTVGLNDIAGKAEKFKMDRLNELEELALGGANLGYFGTVKPSVSAIADTTKSAPERVARAASGVAGDVLETAAYASPLGGSSFWGKVMKSIPAALEFGGAKTATEISQGSDVAPALLEGDLTALSTIGGLALLDRFGAGLSGLGKRVVRSKVGQKLQEYLTAFAENIYQNARGFVEDNQVKIGEALKEKFSYMQDLYDRIHFSVADEYATQAKRPTSDFLQSALEQHYQWRNDLFNRKRAAFGEVFSPDNTIQPVFTNAKEALDSATKKIGDKMGDFKVLSNYIDRYINPLVRSQRPVSLEQIDLARAMAPNSGNELENTIIQNLQMGLRQDIENNLKNTDQRQLLERWKESLSFDKYVNNVTDNQISSNLISAPSSQAFVDNLVSGSINDPRQISNFMGSLTKETQNDVRNAFVNSLLDKAQQIYGNQGAKEAASFLDSLTSKYADTQLLDPKARIELKQITSLYDNDFDSFLTTMKQLLGYAPEHPGIQGKALFLAEKQQEIKLTNSLKSIVDSGKYSLIGDFVSKIKSTEQLETVINGLPKEMRPVIQGEIIASKIAGNQRIIYDQAAGKFNFSGIVNSLNSIGGPNKEKTWEILFGDNPELVKNLKQLSVLAAREKDLNSVTASSPLAASMIHTIAAILYGSMNHPIGAYTHAGMAITPFLSTSPEKATAKQIEEAVYQMLLNTPQGQPGAIEFGPVVKAAMKLGSIVNSNPFRQAAKATINASGGNPQPEEYKKAAEEKLGRPLTDQEERQLEEQYRANFQ